jgi:hypothetical protein
VDRFAVPLCSRLSGALSEHCEEMVGTMEVPECRGLDEKTT